jgi:Fic family protein
VPNLVTNLFLPLINSRIRNIMDSIENEHIAYEAIALACDAHTMFVHIHPFPDGNGRLARVISGLVLQAFGLPAPMFTKEGRYEYIQAVSDAVVKKQYRDLCVMHADAILRSLHEIMELP